MKKIVLIGFAACFKSSAGKLLADKLGWKFVDTDSEIESKSNLTVAQIFDGYGEAHFRAMESELLATLATEQNAVISCGGGSALSDSFAQLATNSVVVWLTASAATIHKRLGAVSRPLFDGLTVAEIEECATRRSPIYERYASVRFATDGKTPVQLADEIYSYITKNI